MATCPECDYDEIETEDFEEGDKLSCPECGKNLILVGPDELDYADEKDEDEDLDDDDDEEEEDLEEEDDDDDLGDVEEEEEEDYDE